MRQHLNRNREETRGLVVLGCSFLVEGPDVALDLRSWMTRKKVNYMAGVE